MMKKVSGGENGLQRFVVNMLGCVTMQEPMLLILEFVSKGDLLSYLRSIRKQVLRDSESDRHCKKLQRIIC